MVKPPTPPPPTETPINFSLTPASPTLTVPFVSGFVDSVPMQILIDSGAAISLLRYDALPQSVHLQILRPPDTVLAVSASGHSLDVVGKVMLPLHLKDVCITHEFTVVRKLAVDAQSGIDFLTSSGAIVDCSKGHLSIAATTVPFVSPHHPLTDDCSKQKNPCSHSPGPLVMLVDTVEIPGRSAQFVQAGLHLPKGRPLPHTFEGLIEPSNLLAIPKHVLVARSLNQVNKDLHTDIQVVNISPGPITLAKGTQLGTFIPLCNVFVVNSSMNGGNPVADPSAPLDFDLSSSELSPQEQQQLRSVLHSFHDVFATPDGPLGHTSIVKHEVRTTGPPIRQPRRRIPVALKDTVQHEVSKMLGSGVIRPSNSPWSAPLVMVQKKDNSWRFCVDYRELNSVTHQDAYPLPRIDATLDALSGSYQFSTLDLASGYWQVEVAEPDKEKTAFSTPQGHFEFNVMPFGLTNVPSHFSAPVGMCAYWPLW